MRKFRQATVLITIALLLVSGCKKKKNSAPDGMEGLPRVQVQSWKTGIPAIQNTVYFLNEQVGFIGGTDGSLYTTITGGYYWQQGKPSPVTTPIRAIHFVDNQLGFAVGGENSCTDPGCTPPGGFILRTVDSGKSWEKLNLKAPKAITAIQFISPSVGFCISGTTLYITTDGGTKWNGTSFTNIDVPLTTIRFTDSQNGYITCQDNRIIRTKDGGTTWKVGTAPAGGYSTIASANGATYISGQQKIIKSLDGGETWQLLANSVPFTFYLQFRDAQVGIGLGSTAGNGPGNLIPALYATTDGGSTWSLRTNLGIDGEFRGLSFPYPALGYAISGNSLVKILINQP